MSFARGSNVAGKNGGGVACGGCEITGNEFSMNKAGEKGGGASISYKAIVRLLTVSITTLLVLQVVDYTHMASGD
jgi:hypothetical protein